MLTFELELWQDIEAEIKPLFPLHWKENANFREDIALDPDYTFFASGKLHFLIARDEEKKLVGYYMSNLINPPNYQTELFSYVYNYFLLPAYRDGLNGIQLIQAYQDAMRKLAADMNYKQICLVGRSRGDNCRLFDWLDWQEAEMVHVKLIKVAE